MMKAREKYLNKKALVHCTLNSYFRFTSQGKMFDCKVLCTLPNFDTVTKIQGNGNHAMRPVKVEN